MPSKPSSTALFSKAGIVCDVLATLGFWYWMTGVISPHVPVQAEPWHTYLALYAASCVSGVFWLGLQCLRATWADQRRQKASLPPGPKPLSHLP
jgi:hypothetical protein